MYANASWLSQTSWIPGESNDDGLEFRSELQAPKFRARAGITYSGNTGLFTNIAYQHDDKIYGFEGRGSKDWVLIDLGEVVLNIMSSSARELYDLESLWDPNL